MRLLSNLEVPEFLVQNNMKTDTESLTKTWEQNKAVKKDLANYLLFTVLQNPEST